MKVGIVVLSWNSKQFIDDCLGGLARHEPSAPVYVLDNGSTDGSADYIEAMYPGIALTRSPWNLGFSAGNNVAVRRALNDGCDAVFLLNNDTIIDEPFLAACVDVVSHDESVGIVGPVVVEARTPDVIQCRGGKIGLWTLDFSYLGKGDPYRRSDRYDAVGYVLGAAMLIRRDVLEKIGLLDEDFFPAYVEEADLCHRARLAGFAVAISDASRVRHIGEKSSGGSDRSFVRFTLNRLRFGLKHLTGLQFAVASHCVAWRAIAHRLAPRRG